jgi:peptidoglycan/xylan/chitin deacetylase (PgdA/CDA1 family)
MYHHVNSYIGEQKTSASLTVSMETFQQQLDYLQQKGYASVSLDELMAVLKQQGVGLPAKPIIITFDDGYEDTYSQALPLLRGHNFKATIFLVTGLIESSAAYLNWRQVKEMQASGLITFGNHTWSHLALTGKPREVILKEITLAQDQLMSFTGQKAEFFAYPYGGDTAAVESVLTELGIKGAVVTFNRLQCEKRPYQLGRIRIGNVPLAAYGL